MKKFNFPQKMVKEIARMTLEVERLQVENLGLREKMKRMVEKVEGQISNRPFVF